ncbi:transposase, partial [Acidipropionibacterium thoenii]
LACDLLAWMGLLAHPQAQARRWEPKKLRHRLFAIPATLARSGRRVILHVSDRQPWVDTVVAAVGVLRGLPAPAG